MAASANLVFKLPFVVWVLGMTIITLVLEVFVSYKTYAKFLKYLTFSLFAYIITVFIVKQDWRAVAASTLVPHISFTQDYIMNVVAFLGTTISPYL
jgi:Mn2+/Fe2+ NRAMP family transporter